MKKSILVKAGSIVLSMSLLMGPVAMAKGKGNEAGLRKLDGSGNPDVTCTMDGSGQRKYDGSGRDSRKASQSGQRLQDGSARQDSSGQRSQDGTGKSRGERGQGQGQGIRKMDGTGSQSCSRF